MAKNFFNSFSQADDDELVTRTTVDDKLDDDDPDKITDVSKLNTAADDLPYADDDDKDKTLDDDKDLDPKDELKDEPKDEPVEELDDDAAWVAAIVNPLAEEGVLYYDPEKEYSAGEEGLVEVINDTVEKRFQEKIESIPEEYRSIIDHLAAGKPLSEWREAVDSFDYSSIDMDDEDNQTNLIAEAMELQGFDADEIKEKLELLEDAGASVKKKEAEMSQKYMVKHTEKTRKEYEQSVKAQVAQRESRLEAEKEKMRADIFALEEISGFKLDKKTKEKLYDHLTKPVGKTGKTQMMLNRENSEKQLLAAYLDMIDYKFEDIEKKAVTKTTRGLKAALNNFTDANGKRTGGSRQVHENKPSLRVPKGIWNSGRELED